MALRILIPTDFSKAAQNAFDYAVTMFGKDAEYVLLNSYEEPRQTAASLVMLQDILRESSEDSLSEEKTLFLSKYPDLNIETISKYGGPVASIVNVSYKTGASYIVMGTTGASGLKGIFMGSVASAVMQKSTKPVLAVPVSFTPKAPERALLSASLGAKDGERIDGTFIELLEKFKSHLTILTVKNSDMPVSEDKAEVGFELHTQLANVDHLFDVVQSVDTVHAIRSYIREHGNDLLVVLPKRQGWVDNLFEPSVSKELAEHVKVPILALA